MLGLFAGTLSGLVGIGGAVVVVPGLIFLFGLAQLQAQGTALAMLLPPIGLLAFLVYYRQGAADLGIAALLCLGFFAGGFFGSKIAVSLSPMILRRVFGTVLLLISLRMILFKN